MSASNKQKRAAKAQQVIAHIKGKPKLVLRRCADCAREIMRTSDNYGPSGSYCSNCLAIREMG